MSAPLLILGCGFTGKAVGRLAQREGASVIAHARTSSHAQQLASEGFTPVVAERLTQSIVEALVPSGVRVLVAFPPDGHTDAEIAPALGSAQGVVYLSTTGVFGAARGRVTEETPVDPREPRARERLLAEERYREQGAVILRVAGIYGPGRGLHRRIAEGQFAMPEGGANVVSRVHVDDLALVVWRALERGEPGATFVVADDTPVPQIEVIRWLCARLKQPLPPSVSREEVSTTLRHDRSVDNRKLRDKLGVVFAYPSYREGFEACLTSEQVLVTSGRNP